jgi:hypothetical protein
MNKGGTTFRYFPNTSTSAPKKKEQSGYLSPVTIQGSSSSGKFDEECGAHPLAWNDDGYEKNDEHKDRLPSLPNALLAPTPAMEKDVSIDPSSYDTPSSTREDAFLLTPHALLHAVQDNNKKDSSRKKVPCSDEAAVKMLKWAQSGVALGNSIGPTTLLLKS